ncbi:MAG: hypothetical protein ACXWVD_00050 [Telluria sp.]
MWTFDSVAAIEQHWGAWYALVTLLRDGVPESSYVHFGGTEPSANAAQLAGTELALRRNLDEAEQAGQSMTRETFLGRFTNAEIAGIYAAAASNNEVFVYVKKMELNPTIHPNHPDTLAGLQALEAEGLIGPGRANQILGL